MKRIPALASPARGSSSAGAWLWQQATGPGSRSGARKVEAAGSGKGNPQRRVKALAKLKARQEAGEPLDNNQKQRFDELMATEKEHVHVLKHRCS